MWSSSWSSNVLFSTKKATPCHAVFTVPNVFDRRLSVKKEQILFGLLILVFLQLLISYIPLRQIYFLYHSFPFYFYTDFGILKHVSIQISLTEGQKQNWNSKKRSNSDARDIKYKTCVETNQQVFFQWRTSRKFVKNTSWWNDGKESTVCFIIIVMLLGWWCSCLYIINSKKAYTFFFAWRNTEKDYCLCSYCLN